jgi:Secretion system C-terminal sorting domain
MRKLFSSVLLLLLFSAAEAQETVAVTGRLVKKTKLLTEIKADPSFTERITRDENGLVGVVKKTAVIRPFGGETIPVADPALQQQSTTPQGVTAASATIGANFNGLGYTSVNPSDPVIVTGPNHVIQMINGGAGSVTKIFNKDGSQAMAQFNFSLITGVNGAGDPVLLYDKLANRWLLTEFGYTGGVTAYVNTLILAVSATENPLGSWYVYVYADNSFFVDFPKFAIWPDGYYATSNDFNTAGTSYLGSSIYAFDRTAMLSGAATATGIRSRLTHADGRFFSMAPVTYEGVTAPPAAAKGMFMYYTNNAFTSDPADVDSIYMITMAPDFVTPASTVISAPTRFVATAFDDQLCTATRGRCIDQQSSAGTDLEDLAGRFSNRIVYRNFGTHQGIVTNFTVDADGAGKGGIRWLEMRNSGAGWSIYQEGTYSPDANERWLGSMTYDAVGNIGLIYNVSGLTANPSIRFTARNPCDPLGTMTLPETVIINGTAANGSTRYGDYNMLAIDPATDRDFWMTAQYNSTGNWSTRIAQFSLNNCAGTPKVRFQTNEVLAYEDSLKTVGVGCTRYRDYVVNVVIDAPPAQPATITFSTAGSTATSGSDFTITPASVILNSGTLTQPVTIRVFADANVESPENILLSYTISNAAGGNAVVDNYNQVCTIKMFDNDKTISPNQNTSILLTEGFGTDAAPGPTSGTWTISSTGANNVWTYSGNLDAGSNGAAHITNNTTTKPLVYTKTTPATSRLRTPLINATAFNSPSDTLKLFARYRCNGELFSGTYYDYGYFMYSTNGTSFSVIPGTGILQGVTASTDVSINLPSSLNGTSFYLAFFWTNDNTAGTDPPFVLDTMSVTASGVKVESVVGSTATEYVTAGQPVFFRSADGELIASISNADNIGCLVASVPNAGVGRTVSTINGNTSFRSDKVIQVTPSSPYAGSYSVTLYFTNAELAAWGGAANTLNILKVADADPLGATINGTTFDPIVADFSATKGYMAYTGVFTGMSKFMLTDAAAGPLAINGLNFNVTPLSKEIKLYWSTQTETNNRGFYIERSTDGTNFGNIGFVTGVGNSSTVSYYSYIDVAVQKGVLYYYRLKEVDINSRFSLSAVKKAIIQGNSTGLEIAPNPANDNCRLHIPEFQSKALITVTDMSGKVVIRRVNQSMVNGNYDLSIRHLATGSYIIKVVSGQGTYTATLVKR